MGNSCSQGLRRSALGSNVAALAKERFATSTLVMIAASVCPDCMADESEDGERLTVERIFDSREFTPERLESLRWLKNRAAYTVLENRRQAE